MSRLGDADLLVAARSALLDALEALRQHADAVVVVGAQAIYLHTGAAPVALAEATKDCDLALDTRALPQEPLLEEVMRGAGFHLDARASQPGAWLNPKGIPVDLMVPEALAGGSGRRAAKIPPHAGNAARRAVGAKWQRRFGSIDDLVIPLTAKGLTTGEVAVHLAEVYGATVSKDHISTITERVMDSLSEWQNRPLNGVYPVIFIDCIHAKTRDGQVANRPVHVALATTPDGGKDVLGLWVGDGGEGAKYWLRVLTELKNRGADRRSIRASIILSECNARHPSEDYKGPLVHVA